MGVNEGEDVRNKSESDCNLNLDLRLSSCSRKEEIRLRAVRDFKPKYMTEREKKELKEILSRRRQTKQWMGTERNKRMHEEERSAQLTTVTKEINDEQLRLQDPNEKQQVLNEPLEMTTAADTDHFMEAHELENTEKSKDLHFERPEENINPCDGFITLANQSNSITEDTTYTQNHEEDIKTVELETSVQKTLSVGQEVNGFDDNSHANEVDSEGKNTKQEDNQASLSDSEESNESDDSVDSGEAKDPRETDPYAAALTIRRGDEMVAILPANIGDDVGWWMVKHLTSGEIGFIPRYTVVIEHVKDSSKITLCDLPMEIFDMFLQKSYLHWILNSPTTQKDEEVIRSLLSVDVCFYQRIIRKRFKRAIFRYLKDFYGKTKKRSSSIRNNKNYLLENIQPNVELMALLVSHNCITQEQRHFIQRQKSTQDKNAKLLYVVKPLDETKFSKFVWCLQQTNQNTVARIIENGGGATKIELQSRVADRAASHQSYKLTSQLKEVGIEIISSRLERRTVVIWIWCRSQAALEYIQNLYESDQLRDVLFENIQISLLTVINIERNQFNKTIVVCAVSISIVHRINMEEDRNMYVHSVAKLRNGIYILFVSYYLPRVIHVFEDQNPFQLQKKIELTVIGNPNDIESNERENCLYVTDYHENVWKITIEEDGRHKIIKWLKLDYIPRSMSVSTDGQFLALNKSSSSLKIYGSDAELIRSIQLPAKIKNPRHAVETSIGNFIILHIWIQEKGESAPNWTEMVMRWVISELSRDGQMVIRRFIPSNETQQLNNPVYLSLDSDDRVFVVDTGNGRVILLDSDLRWNRILFPTRNKEETLILWPKRLCYDEKNRRLIIVGKKVDVYSISRK